MLNDRNKKIENIEINFFNLRTPFINLISDLLCEGRENIFSLKDCISGIISLSKANEW
ncbi:hypothetical protein CBE01nite_17900 [Clostridium beijerinckii]|uniref:Uncharacterized protein n=1 Tax=Clostridium diolis TaxID=223919 RepID=A0AAV3V8S6_9CLOT|nr:hypothetical protein CDIOL_16340 [Clostridium diolis]GEP64022.1 hypothetical protein CBE01nite_17900 [Clostridium beijerinckii]